MCGIFGFSGLPDPELLRSMGELVAHRGPDGVGYWHDGEMSLGARRLAIVDLETGNQPASNEQGTCHVVFNGEIYNHRELRAELEREGYRFRSRHSDTEVLAHLFERHGPDFLHRLNGMFAIALWDAKRRELHL